MNNPALPHGLDRGLPFRRFETAGTNAYEKIFLASCRVTH